MHMVSLEPSSLKRNVLQEVLNFCVHNEMPCSECTCLVDVWCYTAVADWRNLASSTLGSSSNLLIERRLSVLFCHSNQQRLTWHLWKQPLSEHKTRWELCSQASQKSKDNKPCQTLLHSASSRCSILVVMQYGSLCTLHNLLLQSSSQKTYCGFSSMNWGHCRTHTDHSHCWSAVATRQHACTCLL